MASDTITIPELEQIETHGIERVSPETRSHVRILDNFTMWFSANLVISTVVLGMLAVPIFGLSFWQALLAIIVFNMLGVLPVAFFSTLGPKLGLRQMTISRFSFGWVGAIVMAIFNIVACIGWSTVNVIVGGQLVNVLSNGVVPIWLGILVIAILTTIVSIYGYKYVHYYERYAWIPLALIFLTMAIVAGPRAVFASPQLSGFTAFTAIVSFGGAIYGFATGWSSYAADYNVNQPEDTSSWRVFWLTFLGVALPGILLETLGVVLTLVPEVAKQQDIGPRLATLVEPLGIFGRIILALLALSVVANNIPNDYSLGLSMQVLGKAFQRVHRAVWTLIGAVVYVVIAVQIVDFSKAFESFLLLIAYWLAPWSIVLILEHFVFRRGNYNVDDWNTPSKLPLGWAALVALVAGLVGVYLGAAQEKFVGPLSSLIGGKYGIDIGFELGIILAGIVYLVLRRVELQTTNR